jgi:hypothetical protein
MWKYRYRREVIPDASWEERCTELGEDGWSLIGAPLYEPTDAWLCFFKRTVSNREQLKAVFALSPERERPA